MKLRVALLLIAASADAASADRIYLHAYAVQRYLTVLAEDDLTELVSIALPPDTGIGIVRGMAIVGEHSYLHHTKPVGGPGRVLEVDLVLRRVSREFATGFFGRPLAYAAGKSYAPNSGDDTVTVIDLATFPGDADCDLILGGGDADATISALYDRVARAVCDADCNGDGRVAAADLVCTLRELAAPVTGRSSPTPFPTRTPRPPTPTHIPTWTPGACSTNSDCPPTGYCEKAIGHCDDSGTCVAGLGAFCLGVYDPVCGCDGVTHSNAGCAAAVGVSVDYAGECRGETGGPR